MSQECNRPELAHAAVAEALARVRYRGALLAALQDEPLGPIEVEEHVRNVSGGQLSLL